MTDQDPLIREAPSGRGTRSRSSVGSLTGRPGPSRAIRRLALCGKAAHLQPELVLRLSGGHCQQSDIGISLAAGGRRGGGGPAVRGAVSIDDEFTPGIGRFQSVRVTATGVANRSDGRFGDYFTIHQYEPCEKWSSATNYAWTGAPADSRADVNYRYVEFEREQSRRCYEAHHDQIPVQKAGDRHHWSSWRGQPARGCGPFFGLVNESVRRIAPGMLQHFPVLLQEQQSLTKDYTFRSRSFVFASLAAAISHMLGNSDHKSYHPPRRSRGPRR
jgi:hypothetical protein